MLQLRKFLVSAFAFVASLEILLSLIAVPAFIGLIKATLTGQSQWHPYASVARLGQTGLFVACALLFATPPVAGCFYGMAWWKLRGGAPAGRRWAIAASCSILAQGIPFYLVTCCLLIYGHGERWRDFALLDLATLALGVGGLLAFFPRNSPPSVVVTPRVAGDGTSSVLDRLALVGSFVGYVFGFTWLNRWGHTHGLRPAHGLLVWEQLIGAILISTALHELGHASAAVALGMRLRAFAVGPFQFRLRQGKWNFKFALSKILGGGGAVGAVPTDPNQPMWHDIVMIAAGPLASLLTGAIALTATLTAVGQFYEPNWEFIGTIGLLGALSFVINLIPIRPEANYSDGAKIYQLLSGGRWADLHRVQALAGATLVTPLRPRDYDMQAIEQASREFTQGAEAIWLRLLAIAHYIDRGEMVQARQASADAEAIFLASQPDLPGGLCASLTVSTALLRRDAVATRQWADRMAAKKSIANEFSVDYWLAQAALQWVENHSEEGRASLRRVEEISQSLPTAGAYNYDRYLCTLLGQALEQTADAPLLQESLVASPAQ